MKFTAFSSTTPIYMLFCMFGMLSIASAVAIPNPAPAASAVDGTQGM